MKNILSLCVFVAGLCMYYLPAAAHMPNVERRDYTEKWPFKIRGTIEKGQAAYACLKSGSDIDVYRFTVTQEEISEKGSVTLRVRVNVPGLYGSRRIFAMAGHCRAGVAIPRRGDHLYPA